MQDNNLRLPPAKEHDSQPASLFLIGGRDKKIEDMFSNYADWLAATTLSHHTKRTYRSQVNEFIGFLSSHNLALETMSENPKQVLDSYRQSLLGRHARSRKSVNTKLKSVASFLRFAGVDADVPVMPVYEDAQKKNLTADEERNVLTVCAKGESARHRLLVVLFLKAGLKLNEALCLRLSDVNHVPGATTLTIGSGSKKGVRTIQVAGDVEAALVDWLSERGVRTDAGGESFLFSSTSGEQMSAATADFVIRRIGWRAGVLLSAQVLRNTCIGRLWTTCNDANRVAMYVGLRSPELVKRRVDVAPF